MDMLASAVVSSLRCEKHTCCGITFHSAVEARHPSISHRSWASPVMVRAGSSDSGPGGWGRSEYAWSERYWRVSRMSN